MAGLRTPYAETNETIALPFAHGDGCARRSVDFRRTCITANSSISVLRAWCRARLPYRIQAVESLLSPLDRTSATDGRLTWSSSIPLPVYSWASTGTLDETLRHSIIAIAQNPYVKSMADHKPGRWTLSGIGK